MIHSTDFPRLTNQNHRITSPPSTDYNCIAWTAGDIRNWWQPGIYWPITTKAGDYSVGALEELFKSFGYIVCPHEAYEPGYEKIALYSDVVFYTHAARQLPNGKWTSKLGGAEDIEHDTPVDLAGGAYGSVVGFMKRPILAASS